MKTSVSLPVCNSLLNKQVPLTTQEGPTGASRLTASMSANLTASEGPGSVYVKRHLFLFVTAYRINKFPLTMQEGFKDASRLTASISPNLTASEGPGSVYVKRHLFLFVTAYRINKFPLTMQEGLTDASRLTSTHKLFIFPILYPSISMVTNLYPRSFTNFTIFCLVPSAKRRGNSSTEVSIRI